MKLRWEDETSRIYPKFFQAIPSRSSTAHGNMWSNYPSSITATGPNIGSKYSTGGGGGAMGDSVQAPPPPPPSANSAMMIVPVGNHPHQGMEAMVCYFS